MLSPNVISRLTLVLITLCVFNVVSFRKYTKEDVQKLREEVRDMFDHAYSSYLQYAYPYDELRPLSCDGVDTWGSYSLTLIDALDTLAVMGNFTEFQRVVKILTEKSNFDANINVSVFETNIRIVGGLLSAHLLSHRAGVELEPGWPCNGPLLRLAEDVAQRLLPAFDTPTGMPYGTVNLRHGVPQGETTITCTAGIGTFILEFGTLSRLTGDPVYEEVALNALYALRHYRSSLGLVGNHVDVATGRWTALDSGIGAGVDSYYEYLAKGAVLLQRPELMKMFEESRVAIDRYLKRDDWHLWVTMTKGQVTLPVFQSLEAFWPGLLSLVGDVSSGMKSLHNYHQVWKQYGFTPEFYNIPQGEVGTNREGYPLRPELAESVMYLARATGDPFLLEVGVDILRSIQHSARTPCGYATIKDTRDHRQEDRMESFFLAETTKYLYLLFDPDNFIHNRGQHGSIVKTAWGECIMEAGGYIFNTEAHPLDPSALHCCSETREHPFLFDLDSFRGETLHAHQRRLERERQEEKMKRKQQIQLLKERQIKESEKTVSVTLDAVLTPPPVYPTTLSKQSSTMGTSHSSSPKDAGKPGSSIDTDGTSAFDNSASPETLRGVGEAVEVQWQVKSTKDDVIWHQKAEGEDEIRLQTQVKQEKLKKIEKKRLVEVDSAGEQFVRQAGGASYDFSGKSAPELNKNSGKAGRIMKDGQRQEGKLVVLEGEDMIVTEIGQGKSVDVASKLIKLDHGKRSSDNKDSSKSSSQDRSNKASQEDKKHHIQEGNLGGLEIEGSVVTEITQGDDAALRGDPFHVTSQNAQENHGAMISDNKDKTNSRDRRNDNRDNSSGQTKDYNIDNRENKHQSNDDSEEGISKDEAVLIEPSSISSIFGSFFTLRSEPQEKPAFDPQTLLERIRMRPQYYINSSWATEYDVLSCNIQPFLQRVSMSGEFFNNS